MQFSVSAAVLATADGGGALLTFGARAASTAISSSSIGAALTYTTAAATFTTIIIDIIMVHVDGRHDGVRILVTTQALKIQLRMRRFLRDKLVTIKCPDGNENFLRANYAIDMRRRQDPQPSAI
jgi:preprotein translocase subunit SecG